MSNAKMTIDNHYRAPDASYVRTDVELAHQRDYEIRESQRADSPLRITYRIDTSQQQQHAGGRVGGAFCVIRRVGNGKEERSRTVYRRSEATDMLKENVWRDEMAAKRLGIKIEMTSSTKR